MSAELLFTSGGTLYSATETLLPARSRDGGSRCASARSSLQLAGRFLFQRPVIALAASNGQIEPHSLPYSWAAGAVFS